MAPHDGLIVSFSLSFSLTLSSLSRLVDGLRFKLVFVWLGHGQQRLLNTPFRNYFIFKFVYAHWHTNVPSIHYANAGIHHIFLYSRARVLTFVIFFLESPQIGGLLIFNVKWQLGKLLYDFSNELLIFAINNIIFRAKNIYDKQCLFWSHLTGGSEGVKLYMNYCAAKQHYFWKFGWKNLS